MIPSLYMRSASDRPPLSVGLLIDSEKLPRCFSEAVDHILQSDFARLDLLIVNNEQVDSNPQRRRSVPRKAWDLIVSRQHRRLLLFSLYQRWDRQNLDPATDPEALEDCTARFAAVESIRVLPIKSGFVHRLPDDVVRRIREKHIDVLIRFGFNILRGDILAAARCGIWSYHHGDGDFYRGGPAHLWEIIEQNPLSGVMLQILTEELDAGQVLCKGWFATQNGLSLARNRVQPYWGASTFVIQKLHELHMFGREKLLNRAEAGNPYRGRKRIYRAPTNTEMLRWLAPALVRKLYRRLTRRPKIAHWRLAIRSGAALIADSVGSPDLSGFRWIESPPGRFYADPFMIEESGRCWCFFEDFDYATNKGRISCAEIGAAGSFDAVPVLERPYHLSYPCIFRVANDLYMIPESVAAGAVELYRCDRFPDRWTLLRNLLELPAVDSTMWFDADRFWLFVTLQEQRGFGVQLCLFSAGTLDGPWIPHPGNPLSTDVRTSRGAGRIFKHRGKLFRPSQDCSEYYGRRFTLNEIVALNGDRYEERRGVTVNPSWAPGLLGTHTYSQSGDVEVIDGCTTLAPGHVFGRSVVAGQVSR
jgi:hypothetical protein